MRSRKVTGRFRITTMGVIGGVALVGGMFATLGAGLVNPAFATSTTPPTTLAASTPVTVAVNAERSPFHSARSYTFSATVDNLQGYPASLARGRRATIVMAMASWCLYCAYEDKYVIPRLAQTPGVVIDIVDVSSKGGIGDPGPQFPAFTGHDGHGSALNVAGMVQTMAQYTQKFGTLSAPNIHVYAATPATQKAWHVTTYPSMAFIRATGMVASAPPGALTLAQAQQALQDALQS